MLPDVADSLPESRGRSAARSADVGQPSGWASLARAQRVRVRVSPPRPRPLFVILIIYYGVRQPVRQPVRLGVRLGVRSTGAKCRLQKGQRCAVRCAARCAVRCAVRCVAHRTGGRSEGLVRGSAVGRSAGCSGAVGQAGGWRRLGGGGKEAGCGGSAARWRGLLMGARVPGLQAVSPARVRPWSAVVVVVGSGAAVLGPSARRAMPFALTRAPLRGRALPAVPPPLRACRPGPPPPPPSAQCRRARPSALRPGPHSPHQEPPPALPHTRHIQPHCPRPRAAASRQPARLPPSIPPTARLPSP